MSSKKYRCVATSLRRGAQGENAGDIVVWSFTADTTKKAYELAREKANDIFSNNTYTIEVIELDPKDDTK
jgi:hypothetical protein